MNNESSFFGLRLLGGIIIILGVVFELTALWLSDHYKIIFRIERKAKIIPPENVKTLPNSS